MTNDDGPPSGRTASPLGYTPRATVSILNLSTARVYVTPKHAESGRQPTLYRCSMDAQKFGDYADWLSAEKNPAHHLRDFVREFTKALTKQALFFFAFQYVT